MKRLTSGLPRLPSGRTLAPLLAPLLVLLLVACGESSSAHRVRGAQIHLNFDEGSITVKKGIVEIATKDNGTALVTKDGEFVIGDKTVKISIDGQAALGRYNAAGRTFIGQTVRVGVDGIHLAFHTLDDVVASVFSGNTDNIEREAEKGGADIEAKAKALCRQLDDWRSAQDAAVAAAPEFKPYALIGEKDIKDCFDDESSHGDSAGSQAPDGSGTVPGATPGGSSGTGTGNGADKGAGSSPKPATPAVPPKTGKLEDT